MTAINRWILSVLDTGPDNEHCQYRVVNIWYNQNYTVYGANPNPGGQAPDANNVVTLHDLGNGTIALQCGGGYNAFASVRDDYGYQVQFQAPNGTWIGGVGGDEILQAIPMGDGYFALYSPTFARYLTVDSGPDAAASNCYPLRAATGYIRHAARFTAAGQDRLSIFDFVRVGKNASGLSFAGANLSNVDLSGGGDLTGCDFRRVSQGSLSGCVLDGAKLQYASFAGLRLDGLSISNADCTHADFSGCDFTSFVPRTPPPVLAGADMTGAVIPAGNSWSGANMPGAVLAEATFTGCDLFGAATNLAGANLSGVGVTLFGPVYQRNGIGGYDLASPADRVIAFDYDGAPGQSKQNYLVCYRPGRGAVFIVRKKSDGTFDNVYAQGDPGNGIGGCKLDNPNDRIIAYDFAGTGHLDHLVCYRPGAGMISIIEKKTDSQNNVSFNKVWDSTSGIGGSGGCDLSDPNDRIIAFDYYGTGHLDHLVCYRVGTGNIWILEKDTDQSNNVTFTPVFSSTRGIGGYDLASPADRIIAFDGDSTPGQPKQNCLICYRPGTGAVFIVRKKSDGTFDNVYAQGDPGNGIGGYPLDVPSDQVFAFDYEGTGHLDHLVCYRPGTGNIWILEKETDQNNNMTFTPVYRRFGIGGSGGCDLDDLNDRIIAYDYAGTDRLDHLVCYRPGPGNSWVIQSRPARPATLEQCNLDGANLSTADLADLDLTATSSLNGANLSGTQLPGAKLAGVNLTRANLAGTNFTGTDLTEVTFSFPLIRSTDPNNPTIFANCTLPYGVIKLDWSCLDLTAATITDLPTDLTGLNACGLRRPKGDFTGFVLDRANFADATLDGANFADAKLRQKPSFAGARLIGAYFTGAVLDQANFAGAALGGIKGIQAANFSSAWISNCNFDQANAYGVSFTGATLISGNTLTGTTSLQESDFSNAYLPYADFTGANLQGGKFTGACMVECVLAHADLTPAQEGAISASLDTACLQGVDFTGTKLMGANLNNAAITNGNGQIQVSHYDEYGNLINPEPISWRAKNFPSEASFSDLTVCPNGHSYGYNKEQGLTIAQMMQALNPPTQWRPPTAAKLSTTATLSSNNNPSANGQQVTFQAQVSPVSGTGVPTGTVNFMEGTNSLGSADLISGTAGFPISSLAEGTHTIQAAYQGNDNFAPSQSAPLTQTVARNFVTPTVDLTVNGSSAGATVSVGDTVTFVARIHAAADCPSPSGSITISDRSGNSYGTADDSKDPNSNDGLAKIKNSSIVAGSYTLVAVYGGDGGNYYNGAQSNTVSLEVKPKASRK
jgi:uncharacterized protein YjbI with pentapeptide repeats